MNSQILLQYSYALPLQTLVEPRLNFCLHFHLGNFSVFALPPNFSVFALPPAPFIRAEALECFDSIPDLSLYLF